MAERKAGDIHPATPQPERRIQRDLSLVEQVNLEIRIDTFSVLRVLGGLHRCLPKYADEFVFRLNRYYLEPQLPERLLRATVDRVPIQTSFKMNSDACSIIC